MPFRPYTYSPAPALAFAGLRAASQGMTRAGKKLGEISERNKKDSQLATSLRKTMSLLQEDRADEFNSMGLGDLMGESRAYVLQQEQEDRQQKQEQNALAMRFREMQLAEQARNQGAQRAFQEEAGNLVGPGPQLPPADLANRLLQSGVNTGAFTPSQTVGLAETLARQQATGQKWNLQPGQQLPLPNGGHAIATSPNQWQVLPPKTQKTPIPPEDTWPEGLAAVPTDDGGWQWRTLPQAPAEVAQFDTDGDGVIDTMEALRANAAGVKGVVEGMRVVPKQNVAPGPPAAAGDSAWQKFLKWK